jgi:hypothetical protein
MVGTIGLAGDPCNRRTTESRLVGFQPRVDSFAVGKHGHRPAQGVVSVDGCRVLVVQDRPMPRATRLWFLCPQCDRRVRFIYRDEQYGVGCRWCCHLKYASQCRSPASAIRIARWRSQIGIDPHPFAPIPKRKRHHLRYHRVVARILIEEQILRGHLRKIAHDLERRARVRGL